MSTTIALKTPYLADGIRSVNFFNGRVLSGEDMAEEQEARREALLRLGRATGSGVAHGLEVTGAVGTSTLTVAPGLAINRLGESLELPNAVDVSLLGAATPAAASNDPTDAFGACGPATTTYVAGEGVFLLVLCPARGREGRAVVGGLASGGLGHSCAAHSIVEGVQFRLLRLGVTDFSDSAHFRNVVAHLCFGTADRAFTDAVADPFGTRSERYGLIDALRGDPLRDATLNDCDVPLAVIHYKDGQAIRFVDQWSARRRLVRPPWAGPWAPLVDDRRTAEAEAMFMQFQEEVASIDAVDLGTLVATSRFRNFPAVGLVPFRGSLGTGGVELTTFFGGLTFREADFVIEGARVTCLLRLGLQFPAIDLSSRELIWVYQVRENLQPRADGSRAQPALLFVSGHVPYFGDARFDVAHTNFGNYAL
jgi:hypothetical protein